MFNVFGFYFKDIYARRAFPCFDEPSFKSVFQVTLNHKSNLKVWSNNKILESNPIDSNDMSSTKFDETPEMVTYLLAFVVSDFECKSSKLDKVDVNVCASPPQVNNTEYADSIAKTVIEKFQERFGISYELPKMDLFAIPDFSAGAMENWGLLTFREKALLWNSKYSSAADKMYIAAVVAHETAHMVSIENDI